MPSLRHGWISVLLIALATVGLAYMLLPLALMIPLSLEPGPLLRFPPQGWSLRWYVAFLSNEEWLRSTLVSLRVACGASLLATVLGTLAAQGLRRASPVVAACSMVLLASPIFLPTLLIAVAIYGMFISLRLVDSELGLIAAHCVLTLPLVVLNVSTSLAGVPRDIDAAASSLGAGPVKGFFTITVPLIRRGILSGAVLAFVVSFDEVIIAMFLSGAHTVTLPRRMLDGVFYEMTPILAAISSLLIVVNLVLAWVILLLPKTPPEPTS